MCIKIALIYGIHFEPFVLFEDTLSLSLCLLQSTRNRFLEYDLLANQSVAKLPCPEMAAVQICNRKVDIRRSSPEGKCGHSFPGIVPLQTINRKADIGILLG